MRFDPDTVQNGHIYSTMKEEKVFISSFSVGYAEDLPVPLSTQVYKWVPANLMLGGNPAMD